MVLPMFYVDGTWVPKAETTITADPMYPGQSFGGTGGGGRPGSISSTAKEYLNNLLKIFPQKVSDGPSVPDYPVLKKQVVDLEQKIQQEALLSNTEKTGLLAICSVARYSAYYWTN